MKFLLAAFVFFVTVAGAVSARADDTTGESLEWLVISRPSIAIEEVASTNPVDAMNLTIQTKLKKVVKGQPPQQASFVRRWQSSAVPGQEDTARPANGTDYLLFFDDKGEVTNAINLQYPSHKLGIGADSRDVAIAVDYSIYNTREAILEIVNDRLQQIAKDAKGPAAIAPKPKRATVPMESAAWNALYDGSACYLLVPNRPEEVAARIIEFSGQAHEDECNVVSRKPFELASPVIDQHHTLTIGCAKNGNVLPKPPYDLKLKFKIVDQAKHGDYEFRWGENPDLLPQHKSEFYNYYNCMATLKLLYSIIPGTTETPPVEGSSTPMIAKWHGDCISDDRWGDAMAFYLNVAPKPAP